MMLGTAIGTIIMSANSLFLVEALLIGICFLLVEMGFFLNQIYNKIIDENVVEKPGPFEPGMTINL